MNKRVHEIAKERGLPAKEVLAKLNAAGVAAKSASSSVDEAAALRVLDNGDKSAAAAKPAPRQTGEQKASTAAPTTPARAEAAVPAPPQPATVCPRAGDGVPADGDGDAAEQAARGSNGEGAHKQRPTRDSLQGERAPGAAGGRRRVVIDSQASRRWRTRCLRRARRGPASRRSSRRRRGRWYRARSIRAGSPASARRSSSDAVARGSSSPQPRSAASAVSVSAQIATCGRPAR